MASSARHKKSLTTEEVIEGVFADRDSENAYSENEYKSEAETETKTEKEFEEEGSWEQITGILRKESNYANVQDNIRRGMASIGRGVRTRGGLRNAVWKRPSKQQEQTMLEEKWKREDRAPNIQPFTGASQINVDLPLNFCQYIAAHDIFTMLFSC